MARCASIPAALKALCRWPTGAATNGGAGERSAGSGEARSGEQVSLQGRRIVIADDDPAVVWFMSGLLKGLGVEVLEAHDGARALSLTYDTWPDLVVSDVLMPKLDGFSLCHEIKRDVAVRDVPVILLSWKEDLLQRVRELGAGADGYLRKEAAAATVAERLREVLRPARAGRTAHCRRRGRARSSGWADAAADSGTGQCRRARRPGRDPRRGVPVRGAGAPRSALLGHAKFCRRQLRARRIRAGRAARSERGALRGGAGRLALSD
ncbi:MAG: response regulator [Pseudomonadota bacterium]